MEYKITGGKILINKYDLPLIEKYTWHIGSDGYARRTFNHRGQKVYMHEVLIGEAPSGLVCDHKNRNKLDNRRRNLRHITKSENLKNSDWYESGELHETSRKRMNYLWSILRKYGLNKLSQLDQAWKLQAMGV